MTDVATENMDQSANPSMNNYQWFAVATFLSEWPTLSYESLIAYLNQEDAREHEELVVWEPFNNYALSENCGNYRKFS
ncbi:hypothetical protein [Legionella maceachernii]|uniref:Uncharacterized protein n=1 Tax=Legionella maceachernii TaxID=466 RepID=A0A0W0VZN8_9GAMM|nr:hypothetical protein [Legionella maceachernii]KTD25158.1 hypothetical protein Lmac_2136 [Legionella maceachernii]SKA27218.1 hypothetical protein SAMN02745128_02951 [Legionella maceachernii]SUP04594.1 Uncharacterised protein [Legionella maceachernii]